MSARKFTCDACGEAVGLHAPRCPHCGKTFDAVRCPKCGHQGPPAAFTDGCPKCHYLSSPARPLRRSMFAPLMGVLVVLLGLAVAAAWVLRAP